jgi:hypothetical protein
MMSLNLYLQCLGMYYLGLILCLCWQTIPGLKKQAKSANTKFSLKEWFLCDLNIIIGNVVFGAILLGILKELVTWKPGLLEYIKFFFVIMGGFGTSLAQERWGAFKKTLGALLDVKANIADNVTGVTTTVKEAVQKGNAATGEDVTKTPQ